LTANLSTFSGIVQMYVGRSCPFCACWAAATKLDAPVCSLSSHGDQLSSTAVMFKRCLPGCQPLVAFWLTLATSRASLQTYQPSVGTLNGARGLHVRTAY
jgi:hypothetical protein